MHRLSLYSVASPKLLALVVTDGKVITYLVDNSGGRIPEETGKFYDGLMSVVRSSSHLFLVPSLKEQSQYLQYLTTAGDVIDITTDSEVVLHNGKLLGPAEKAKLFDDVRNGLVQVAKKPDPSKPYQVMPVHGRPLKEPETKAIPPKKKPKPKASRDYDPEIENKDWESLVEQGDADEIELYKKWAYKFKYGSK